MVHLIISSVHQQGPHQLLHKEEAGEGRRERGRAMLTQGSDAIQSLCDFIPNFCFYDRGHATLHVIKIMVWQSVGHRD